MLEAIEKSCKNLPQQLNNHPYQHEVNIIKKLVKNITPIPLQGIKHNQTFQLRSGNDFL